MDEKKMSESYLKELPPSARFYVRVLKFSSEKAVLKTSASVTNYIPRKINYFYHLNLSFYLKTERFRNMNDDLAGSVVVLLLLYPPPVRRSVFFFFFFFQKSDITIPLSMFNS